MTRASKQYPHAALPDTPDDPICHIEESQRLVPRTFSDDCSRQSATMSTMSLIWAWQQAIEGERLEWLETVEVKRRSSLHTSELPADATSHRGLVLSTHFVDRSL